MRLTTFIPLAGYVAYLRPSTHALALTSAQKWSRLTQRGDKVIAMTKERLDDPVPITLRPKLPFDCRIQASLERM